MVSVVCYLFVFKHKCFMVFMIFRGETTAAVLVHCNHDLTTSYVPVSLSLKAPHCSLFYCSVAVSVPPACVQEARSQLSPVRTASGAV